MSEQPPKNPVPPNLVEHAFKPGQSGNPAGRPALDPEVRKLQRLNRKAFELLLDELMWMSRKHLIEVLADESTPVVKAALARIIIKGIKDGDSKGLAYLLDQQIGKATVKIEASGPNNTPLFGSARTPEERAQRIRETQLALEKIKRAEDLATQHGISSTGAETPPREPGK